jgi:hypothetical protein
VPRYKAPTTEDDADDEAIGNVDLSKLSEAQRNEKRLQLAFSEGITKMRRIIANGERNPAAAVSAFRAVSDVLQGKQQLELARRQRAKSGKAAKPGSDREALREVLRSFTREEILETLEDGDTAPAAPSEVDFRELQKL